MTTENHEIKSYSVNNLTKDGWGKIVFTTLCSYLIEPLQEGENRKGLEKGSAEFLSTFTLN